MYIKTPNKILAWHFASRIYHTSRQDKIVSLYKSSSNESAFEYINLNSVTRSMALKVQVKDVLIVYTLKIKKNIRHTLASYSKYFMVF